MILDTENYSQRYENLMVQFDLNNTESKVQKMKSFVEEFDDIISSIDNMYEEDDAFKLIEEKQNTIDAIKNINLEDFVLDTSNLERSLDNLANNVEKYEFEDNSHVVKTIQSAIDVVKSNFSDISQITEDDNLPYDEVEEFDLNNSEISNFIYSKYDCINAKVYPLISSEFNQEMFDKITENSANMSIMRDSVADCNVIGITGAGTDFSKCVAYAYLVIDDNVPEALFDELDALRENSNSTLLSNSAFDELKNKVLNNNNQEIQKQK